MGEEARRCLARLKTVGLFPAQSASIRYEGARERRAVFVTQRVRRVTMDFLKKLKFWKRRKDNVSPITVDVGVSTEEPEKCDVGTMTVYEVVGRATNSDEAPLAENAEWCES